MNLAFKLATYILVISTFDNTSTIPIFSREHQNTVVETSNRVLSTPKENDNILRSRRQNPIVQPVWTSDQEHADSDEDYDVTVTDEKLEQTEAIRDFIHRIIENGSFAVDLDKGDFKEDGMVPEAESEAELEAEVEALEFTEESRRASKAEAVQESETAWEPETVIEIDLTPEVPEVKPIPELKPVEVFKNPPQSITPSKFASKSKKIESVDSPFLTWIKKTFRNPWGTI